MPPTVTQAADADALRAAACPGVGCVRQEREVVAQAVENRQSFARPRSGSTPRVSGAVPVPPEIGAKLPVPRLAVARTDDDPAGLHRGR